jgi:hypothetical protein
MQTWRYLLAASAVLFIAGVALQFLLIGLALTRLGGSGDAGLHVNVGYLLPIVPLLTLILCWPARAGGRMALLVAALFVDTFVQGILPTLRDAVPVIAALHPVNALVLFGLGLVVARRAMALARTAPLPTGNRVAPSPQS